MLAIVRRWHLIMSSWSSDGQSAWPAMKITAIPDEWSATRKLELRGDIPASHMGSRSTTPLLRNPTEVRHCSQHAGANVDFGGEGAVDWAFLGNLKQLRALLLG
jgi:hypothetical protein